MAKLAGMKLRCHNGHWEFANWQLAKLPGGYGMVARCDFGDHWLAEAVNGNVCSQNIPYAWNTAGDAEWARGRWEQQEAGSE